ncbi:MULTISPECIES: DMT family transporter [unclassified Paenibacillus]|uniref:DMT family transporter n=1 Tax=unclassified Paenibacillus TaxID=185978 RepID=UPI002040F4A6|nr:MULTISPECIES: DMT family transporter [unclassified Paenibacillus]MCM3174578.1 DMT family transporter [Paenibacillus sp. MER 99-2]
MGIGLLIVIVTLIGGAVLGAQSSLNGKISRTIGLLETVFFTFASGALVLAVLVVFFGSGHLFDLIHAPKLQLAAVFLGFGYLFLSTFSVNMIGVTPANLTAIVGQLLAGFVIDAMGLFGSEIINFSWQRGVSLVLMLVALALIFSEKTGRVESVK